MSWALDVDLSSGGGGGSGGPDASAVDVVGGGGVGLSTVHTCSGRLVHTAAARARIRDLEGLGGDAGRAEALALATRCACAMRLRA
jgi:hypothetical protein